jgi:hypothetical protein
MNALGTAMEPNRIEDAYDNLATAIVANATAIEHKVLANRDFTHAMLDMVVAGEINAKDPQYKQEHAAARLLPELWGAKEQAEHAARMAEVDLELAKLDVEAVKTHIDAGRLALSVTKLFSVDEIRALAKEMAEEKAVRDGIAFEAESRPEPMVGYEFQVVDDARPCQELLVVAEDEIPY